MQRPPHLTRVIRSFPETMTYSTRDAAHRAMIRQAEREFQCSLRLPCLTVIENPATGQFSIRQGEPSVEDGLACKAGEISTNQRRNP